MLNDLKRFLHEYSFDLPITLGYSGGLDSSVLLHMLVQLSRQGLNQPIKAVHIHHGLSINADSWAEHCENICQESNVSFDIAYAKVKQSERKSLEQIARDARYEFLDKLSEKTAVILTAQHQDDQAETLLLQLMRGAGPKGLSAMSASSVLANGRQVLRPLLSVTRKELEDYARTHQLEWIEDESNNDSRFDRNFLRNQIIPLLKARWPSASKTISRSALLCEGQQALVEQEALKKLQKAKTGIGKNQTLRLDVLTELTPAWFSEVLRLWFREWQVELPSASVMRQIYQQVLFASHDSQMNIQLAGFQLRRYDQALYLISDGNAQNMVTEKEPIIWEGDDTLFLPHLNETYYIEKSKLGFPKKPDAPISVEFGHLSEKFKFQSNRPSKTVKQWFKEWKIPPWERTTIPFFYCESKLVQIGDKVNLLNESTQKADFYIIKCKSHKLSS